LKPSTVVKRWEKAVDKLKKQLTAKCEKEGIKGRDKSRLISKACSRLAKEYAGQAGMKSMGEVKFAADLEKRGIKYKYEATTVEYQHKPQKYTPDFDLELKGIPHVEYKGKLDYETRKKLLAIRNSNPDMEIILVFEKANNKIRKGSKITYGQWAESKGFKWSESVLREEWL
jgi:hypothetical protein